MSSLMAPQECRKNFAFAAALDEIDDLLVQRLDDVAVGGRAEERRMLGAQVVGLGRDVDVRADLVEHLLPVGQLEIGDHPHQRPGQVRVQGHVHVPVLVATHAEVHLGHARAQRAHEDRPPLDVADVGHSLPHALEPAGIDRIGPGIGLDVVAADSALQW